MAVISVSIIESTEEIISGIPRNIAVATNISSSIFYTLNGDDPTLFSTIYTGPIYLPTDKLSITLKVFATNGTDSSPIISETYITNILNNARLPHSSTDAQAGSNIPGLYPFGTNPIQPNSIFLNPGAAGINVNDPNLPVISNAFTADGYPSALSNQPYNLENYSIVYATTDAEGQTGRGIGTLPAIVTVIEPTPAPETTEQFTSTFDPRAFVIFQDFTKENPEDPPQINRQFFTLEDQERSRDGNNYFTSGLDAPPVSGSFLRAHYNPRTNMLTHYYRDNWTNRWIISTAPYQPSGSFDGNLASIALSNRPGAGFVFQWQNFARRVLF